MDEGVVKIERVENGYILTTIEGAVVFENDEGVTDYNTGLKHLLQHLTHSTFDEDSGNKFSKERIAINLEEGKNYDQG